MAEKITRVVKRQRFFLQVCSLPFLGSEGFRQKGKEIYQSSVKNLPLSGLSWTKMVRDYNQLFRPLAQPALS